MRPKELWSYRLQREQSGHVLAQCQDCSGPGWASPSPVLRRQMGLVRVCVCARRVRSGVGCAQRNPRKFWAPGPPLAECLWVADRLLTRPKEKIWARVHRWLGAQTTVGGGGRAKSFVSTAGPIYRTRVRDRIASAQTRWASCVRVCVRAACVVGSDVLKETRENSGLRVRRWRNGVADRLLTRPKEKIWARVHRWLAGFVCADDELGGVLVCAYLRNGVADRLLTRPKEKIWARVHRWLAEWGC